MSFKVVYTYEQPVERNNSKGPVIIQLCTDAHGPRYGFWCVQYAGNGHYFHRVTEAFEYIEKRFGLKIPEADAAQIRAAEKEAIA